MAMKKRYYSVNGEIIGEQTTGQERIDYLTDPLGNVTATIDQNAKVLNRYTYKPFGEVLSKEGTAPDPKFLWVGAHGYRQTGKKYADVYVRARHYDTRTGRWTSKDPIGFQGSLYTYVIGNPISKIDYTGKQVDRDFPEIRRCLDKSPGACFWCLYNEYSRNGGRYNYCPQKACDLARIICRANIVICGPCGPGHPQLPTLYCSDVLYNPERTLEVGNWFLQECGGVDGADKMAHCIKGCLAVKCASPLALVGICAVRVGWPSEEHKDDKEAEDKGMTCGTTGRDCTLCCSEATYDMKCY
jgi:RHS repeat-associated protein